MLVEPQDPLALKDALLDLAENPRKRISYAKKAHEYVQKSFSINKMLVATQKLYD